MSRYDVKDTLPKLRSFSHEWDAEVVDDAASRHDHSSAALTLDLDKCIKCGRCVTMCGEVQVGWVGGGTVPGREGTEGRASGAGDRVQCMPMRGGVILSCDRNARLHPRRTLAAAHERPGHAQPLAQRAPGRAGAGRD